MAACWPGAECAASHDDPQYSEFHVHSCAIPPAHHIIELLVSNESLIGSTPRIGAGSASRGLCVFCSEVDSVDPAHSMSEQWEDGSVPTAQVVASAAGDHIRDPQNWLALRRVRNRATPGYESLCHHFRKGGVIMSVQRPLTSFGSGATLEREFPNLGAKGKVLECDPEDSIAHTSFRC